MKQHAPLSAISYASVRKDIEEFAAANSPTANLNALTLTEALEMYLRWNGIHGYTAQVLNIVKAFTEDEGR